MVNDGVLDYGDSPPPEDELASAVAMTPVIPVPAPAASGPLPSSTPTTVPPKVEARASTAKRSTARKASSSAVLDLASSSKDDFALADTMLRGDSAAVGQSLSQSHPLSEELASLLKAVAARFQNPGRVIQNASAIKFQRRAIDTSSFYERIAQLEAENAQLTSGLAVLRPTPAPPLPTAASDSAAAAEITLTLCCLSAKLSLTETALQEPTTPARAGQLTRCGAQPLGAPPTPPTERAFRDCDPSSPTFALASAGPAALLLAKGCMRSSPTNRSTRCTPR
ncbi:hypothetical protein C8J57DRAFT_1726386 [Mycena rebaudengoi]|nr:hypothetical protein C8J57DRAFT_1726386 [Mycena rebaudengoi]